MEAHKKNSTLPLWTAAKAWWSDTAAQECRNLNWFFLLAIFIASTIAISLPFAANRWREAANSAKTSNYPGLGTAFETLSKTDIGFSIHNNSVEGSGMLTQQSVKAGDWLIVVTGNHTPVPDFEQARNLLQIGPDRIVIRNSTTGYQLNAPLAAFDSFSSETIRKAAANRRTLADLIESLLFTAAFSSIPSIILTLFFLMSMQNLAFVAILGVMLSFAVYRKKQGDEPGQVIRPLEGIKMAAAIMAGPAFVIGLVGLFIPAFKAPFLWLAYSLLAGIRVIALYTSRYRSAGRQQQGQ